MKHPAQFGGDYSRQFDFFSMGPVYGPTNSAERNPVGPPQEPYEPKTNINASPAVRPGESTFPTGTSNHSGNPEEPVGSLYMGADDSSAPDPETFDNDTQIVTSPDEDEEIDRIDDDLREEAIADQEDEESGEEASEEESAETEVDTLRV